MKKSSRVVCLIIVLAMAVALAACAPAEAPASQTPSASTAPGGSAEPEAESQTADKPLKLGYIITFASHEWYANQVKGAQDTAKELGYEFVLADANNDQATQISVGENLLAQDIDALIMAPVDAKGAMPLIEKAQAQGVPVITTSVLAPSQDVYIGCTDLDGGLATGKYAGQYVLDNKLKAPKVLLVTLPALQATVDRAEGFKQGMLELVPDATFVEVDGGGSKDLAMEAATDALTANPDVTMIAGINDESTLGGMQAYKALGMDASKAVAWGYGLDGAAAKNELADPNSMYKGSIAMFPEYFGRLTVLAARDLSEGKEVAEWIAPPIEMITPDNMSDYYVKNGEAWDIQWPAVEALGYDEKTLG